MVKGVGSSNNMSKGAGITTKKANAKDKQYRTVDYLQSHFSYIPEGLKAPFNKSEKPSCIDCPRTG